MLRSQKTVPRRVENMTFDQDSIIDRRGHDELFCFLNNMGSDTQPDHLLDQPTCGKNRRRQDTRARAVSSQPADWRECSVVRRAPAELTAPPYRGRSQARRSGAPNGHGLVYAGGSLYRDTAAVVFWESFAQTISRVDGRAAAGFCTSSTDSPARCHRKGGCGSYERHCSWRITAAEKSGETQIFAMTSRRGIQELSSRAAWHRTIGEQIVGRRGGSTKRANT